MLKSDGKKFILITLVLLTILCSTFASAEDVTVANSKNWVDVYSSLLSSAFQGDRAIFLNSESITAISRILSKNDKITIHQSKDPFINTLKSQLETAGYSVVDEEVYDSPNIDLDIKTGKYLIMSEDNPRISLSLAPLAIKENAWVLIVNEDRLDEIVDKLKNADEVIAVGGFKRKILDEIEPYITKRINNKNIFEDSQKVADLFNTKNMVLADGTFLESEFFTSKNPVLLAGTNKILEDTFDYLEKKNIKSVVVVGNSLAVVGEQIRSKSNKKISVFIKFGQSDTSNTGKVYALNVFKLPRPAIGLTVKKVIYDPIKHKLIVHFTNMGNVGIYALSTISIKNKDREVASVSDSDVLFLGQGENLQQAYDVEIPPDQLTDNTKAEFFTSFGLTPSELDQFLTMKNKYGPPFSIGITQEEIGDDSSNVKVLDVSYYKGLKRVGVKLKNTGSSKTYYTVKIKDLIVNGLEKDLFKEDEIDVNEEKITYIPVQLDEVDLQDNEVFHIDINYGKNKDAQIKNVKEDIAFKVVSSSGLTGFVTGVFGESSAIPAIILVVIIVGAIGFIFYKKKRK